MIRGKYGDCIWTTQEEMHHRRQHFCATPKQNTKKPLLPITNSQAVPGPQAKDFILQLQEKYITGWEF